MPVYKSMSFKKISCLYAPVCKIRVGRDFEFGHLSEGKTYLGMHYLSFEIQNRFLNFLGMLQNKTNL